MRAKGTLTHSLRARFSERCLRISFTPKKAEIKRESVEMTMGAYVVKPVSGDDGIIHHILSRRIIT